MTKITMIGAGSVVFAKNLLGDILSHPELAGSEIALMDIDPERLRVAEIVAHRVAEAVGAKPCITATTDRRAALDGADYAVNMIQVGGYKPSTVIDFEIPEEVRPPPDDRGHARHRRHLPRTADDPRRARHVPGHGSGLPGRPLPQLRQPDGDGDGRGAAGDAHRDGRALP